MISRRSFIAKTLTIAGISYLYPNTLWAADEKKLTILHTNDMHSRIEAFPSNAGKYANLGGMAKRAALIQKIRNEEENVLLLDAGDIFQGTPYFNYFGGELEFKLMSKMQYDAATLGNHDFDNGLEGLNKQLPHANFPFLIANYDFNNTSLTQKFQPYKIFNKKNIKVGVFGIGIQLKGLVAEKNYEQTIYQDPIGRAQEVVKILQEKNCDLIICLSHLGYRYDSAKVSDHTLAQEVEGIDIIIGGHTHTFLEKPTLLKGKQGKDVLINQVGWAGINLGRIDCTFLRKNKSTYLTGTSLLVK